MKNHDKLREVIHSLLEEIGEDPTREGLLKTPSRVARSWRFFSEGYGQNLDDIINNATFHEEAKDIVIIRDVEFFSLCEHHLLPFFGKCHVGYVPSNKVIGLSKIPRLVDMFARRLQVQERLTQQIAETIEKYAEPKGGGGIIQAQHLCMMMRGVQKQNSKTITSAMRGSFLEEQMTRDEFLRLCMADHNPLSQSPCISCLRTG